MPAMRTNRGGWGAVLLISVGLTGCPGYLEEQAWFPDGGRVGYLPPSPTVDGPTAAPTPPVAGSGVAPTPVAGSGGSGSGAGGSGGNTPAPVVKMDGAVKAEAGRPRTAVPRPTP